MLQGFFGSHGFLLWEEEGNKGRKRNGKSTEFQRCREEEEEGMQGGTSCSNPAPAAATASQKTRKNYFPVLFAPLTKPFFPRLLPEHSQLSQSAPVLPCGEALGIPSFCWKPSLVLGREVGLEHPGPGWEGIRNLGQGSQDRD